MIPLVSHGKALSEDLESADQVLEIVVYWRRMEASLAEWAMG